jgi:phage-related holin
MKHSLAKMKGYVDMHKSVMINLIFIALTADAALGGGKFPQVLCFLFFLLFPPKSIENNLSQIGTNKKEIAQYLQATNFLIQKIP